MGTKLPSSNWSAEILTKLFTSADAHTLTGVTESQSTRLRQSAFHPFIYPSFIPRFIPRLLLHRSRYWSQEPQSPEQKIKTPKNHINTQTHPHTLAVIFFYNLNQRAKRFGCFVVVFLVCFFYNIFIPASVCACVCSWVVSHPEQPLCCSENKACLKLS